MGPVWLLKPPPPPQPPEYPNRLMFLQMKKILSIVVLLSPLLWGLHDTLVPHTVHPGPPPPPNNKKLILSNFYQITSIFYILLEDSFELCEKYISKMFMGPWSIYIYKCLLVLLTHVCWFRATGGYICGCGRPSNLVSFVSQVAEKRKSLLDELAIKYQEESDQHREQVKSIQEAHQAEVDLLSDQLDELKVWTNTINKQHHVASTLRQVPCVWWFML